MNAPSSSAPLGRHAVVLGGSMAGLLAAGLLARHFEHVTLVERDRLEDSPRVRKGVPQGAQTHVLLRRGLDLAAEFFPGLPEQLRAAGAHVLDMSADCAWHAAGVWKRRIQSGVCMYTQTRPLFEHTVRTRLKALPNVRLLDGREATGLRMSADGTRVTGLQVREPGGGPETALEADLVVDAGGRGSRTPQWLEALGYPRPQESLMQVDVGYATRLYRQPEGFDAGWKAIILSAELPRLRRNGAILPVEGGAWMVTLSGWLGDDPPTDDAGFLEYTRTLCTPHIHEALRNAEPLSPPARYRFTQSQWRHYERLPRVPEGLVVVGDAFCSFNPIYGQGITTGALQVDSLGACLREGGLGGLARRYFARTGELLKLPWAISTTEDLKLAEVPGRRPPGSGVLNWYGERFQRLTAVDEQAVQTFMEVMHMLSPPTVMFAPRLLLKALTSRPSEARLPAGPPLLAIRERMTA